MVTIFNPGEYKDYQSEAVDNSSISMQETSATSLIACNIKEALRRDLHEIGDINWGNVK